MKIKFGMLALVVVAASFVGGCATMDVGDTYRDKNTKEVVGFGRYKKSGNGSVWARRDVLVDELGNPLAPVASDASYGRPFATPGPGYIPPTMLQTGGRAPNDSEMAERNNKRFEWIIESQIGEPSPVQTVPGARRDQEEDGRLDQLSRYVKADAEAAKKESKKRKELEERIKRLEEQKSGKSGATGGKE